VIGQRVQGVDSAWKKLERCRQEETKDQEAESQRKAEREEEGGGETVEINLMNFVPSLVDGNGQLAHVQHRVVALLLPGGNWKPRTIERGELTEEREREEAEREQVPSESFLKVLKAKVKLLTIT
jgi:hypothetical protein